MRKYSDLHDIRLPQVITGVIAFLLLIYVWHWLDMFILPSVSAPVLPSPAVLSLDEWHLFGVYRGGIAQDIEKTTLPLTLEGVIVDMLHPSHSYAIVVSPSTPALPYKVGEVLPGGAILKQVLKQEIILDNNGNLQSLQLPVDELTSLAS